MSFAFSFGTPPVSVARPEVEPEACASDRVSDSGAVPARAMLTSAEDRAQALGKYLCDEVEIDMVVVDGGSPSSLVKVAFTQDDAADLLDETLESIVEDSDLAKGVYEGGLKVWEATLDLMTAMGSSLGSSLGSSSGSSEAAAIEAALSGGRGAVLDLGCGHGLAGIYAKLAFPDRVSHVILQDYNAPVLEIVTLANARLNLGKDGVGVDDVTFVAGDWGGLPGVLDGAGLVDVILSAETIYDVSSYGKLVAVLDGCLAPGGVAYFAAKTYYYGVGGGVAEFIAAVQEAGYTARVVSKIKDGHSIDRQVICVSNHPRA